MLIRFRATLKPYWTWIAAIVLSVVAWSILINAERNGDWEGGEVWVSGNLATALFFAVPLSQVVTKLFGRVAGPARNRLAHVILAFMSYVLAFGFLAVLLFLISQSMMLALETARP